MARTLLTLALIAGALSAHPAAAQDVELGPPLIDGLGGPLGYGEPHDWVSPVPIDAAAPNGLSYYGATVDAVFVNWIGSVSFAFVYPQWQRQPLPRDVFQQGVNPVLAVFENSSELPGFRPGDIDPTPAYVAVVPPVDDEPGRVVATWHRVPDRPDDPAFGQQRLDDWQLILTVSDDPGRYTIEMRYSRCEWLFGLGRPDNLPVVGFDAGQGPDGPGWTWPGSRTADARLLCALSNVREPGVFRYEVIDGIPRGCGPDADPPPGADRCADGNHLPGDGCSPACHVEPDVDGDGIYEAPDPTSVDPLGVYDDCSDPAEPLCVDDPDRDGVPSAIDNCDDVANPDQLNYDGDRFGDACDRDDDGDDLDDVVIEGDPLSHPDSCPYLYNQGERRIDPDVEDWVQSLDSDHDGMGDPCDPDDDDDGVLDCGPDGICPPTDNGYNEDRDRAIDEAGECDPDDARFEHCDRGDRDLFDNDGDGRVDEASERTLPRQPYPGPDAGEDNCRTVPNPDQADLDGDHLGDACDQDVDNDGVSNCNTGICGPDRDFRDNDRDGAIDEEGECALGCHPDSDLIDQDLDGFVDEGFEPPEFTPPIPVDNCPDIANPDQRDSDGDGMGDACADDDGDGLLGHADNCPFQANPNQEDTDTDGLGDACDGDDDADGIPDAVDVCPRVADRAQADTDDDGIGDACDSDDDNDDVPDGSDNCPLVFNREQADLDGDGIGDACDRDQDGDGRRDVSDNCPRAGNPEQADQDSDGIGDVCDEDVDGDGFPDAQDVCPSIANATQSDIDGDGIGDACDPVDDRPFLARPPEERCAILLANGAPTADRLRHCPPTSDDGCSAMPGRAGPSPACILVLLLLGMRRPKR